MQKATNNSALQGHKELLIDVIRCSHAGTDMYSEASVAFSGVTEWSSFTVVEHENDRPYFFVVFFLRKVWIHLCD